MFAGAWLPKAHAQHQIDCASILDRVDFAIGNNASKRPSPTDRVQGVAASIYRVGAKVDRRRTTATKLPRPVISVGNIAVGGRAKTPLVVKLSKQLRSRGFEPVVLTRGHGRESKGASTLRRGEKYTRADFLGAGDEPTEIFIRSGASVLVGADRVKNAQDFLENHPNPEKVVFLLDDGAQHWKLDRDVDIISLDASDKSTGLHGRRYLRETFPDVQKRLEEGSTTPHYLEIGKDFSKHTYFKAQPSRKVATISITARAKNQAQAQKYQNFLSSYFVDLENRSLMDHAAPEKLLSVIRESDSKQVILGFKEAVKVLEPDELHTLLRNGSLVKNWSSGEPKKRIYLADLDLQFESDTIINKIIDDAVKNK